jgi:hypothetical protein
MVDSMAMPTSVAFRQLEAGLRDQASEVGQTPDGVSGRALPVLARDGHDGGP